MECLAVLIGSLGNVLQNPTSMVYNLIYIGMIYFFCYFWTAITFNPEGDFGQSQRQRDVHSRLSAGPPDRGLS